MPARQKIFLAFAAAAPVPLTLEGLRANPLVPGVAVISEGPARGHSCYDEVNGQMVPMWVDAITLQTVADAAAAYASGLRVNAGHFTEITEAAARLNNFRIDGAEKSGANKLRGDLSLFRSYSRFDHLCELITTIPDTFGLSIDFEGPPEIRDGKGFARCVEIFSCDLVPTPAANEGGLFSRDFSAAQLAQLRRFFDNPATINMPDPANPPATPPATPPANPPANPPATPPAPDHAAITKAVTDALETALGPVKTELTGLTQRLAAVEAAQQADAADDAADETVAMPPPLKRLRKEVFTLQKQIGEQGRKLAQRFGLEFAARAGTNPVENPSAGHGDHTESRQAFEIPAAERNSQAVAKLLGLK